jgi:hypothetical protein
MERARALPVRGQGLSHLEQQAKHLQRTYTAGCRCTVVGPGTHVTIRVYVNAQDGCFWRLTNPVDVGEGSA